MVGIQSSEVCVRERSQEEGKAPLSPSLGHLRVPAIETEAHTFWLFGVVTFDFWWRGGFGWTDAGLC